MGETRVMETRRTPQGARRRRYCSDPRCTGRVTTLEVVVATEGGLDSPITGDWVFMRRDQLTASLETLRVALEASRGPGTTEGTVGASPPQRTARLSHPEPKVCQPDCTAEILDFGSGRDTENADAQQVKR